MFKNVTQQLKAIHNDQRGQGMAEYGLIIALVAVVAIIAFRFLGERIGAKVEEASDALQ